MVLLAICAISTAIFGVTYAAGDLGSAEDVASAMAIGVLAGIFLSYWEARGAGRTLEQRVEYGRKLDRHSRRDMVISFMIILAINVFWTDFDPLILVGTFGALLVYTAYFIFDRWVVLPRIIARSGETRSQAPTVTPELPGPEKDLRERAVFAALWLVIIAANLIAGILSPRFTGGSGGDFAFGIVAGLVFGATVMIVILGFSSGSRNDERFLATTAPLLLVGMMSVDDIFLDAPGPASTTALLITGSFGFAATVIDRWIALPRQLAGDPRSVLAITEGGQVGLIHRGHVVAAWAMVITFSGFVVGVDALDSGISGEATTDGIAAGLLVGCIACVAVAWDARGSYSDRVERTARVRTLPASRRLIPMLGGSVAIVSCMVVLAPSFAASSITVLIAALLGLLATLIDRWIITPRKMDADPNLAFG